MLEKILNKKYNRIVQKLQFQNNFLLKTHFCRALARKNARLVREPMGFSNKSNISSSQEQKMGNFDLNSGTIEDFKVEEIEEKDGYKVLHLTIETHLEIVKYRIAADTREPSLEAIRDDLNKALNQAKNNECCFGIDEYKERSYISVTFPNGNGKRKQYTAQRLF